MLDSQFKSLVTENGKMDALKLDLAEAIRAKMELEKKLISSEAMRQKLAAMVQNLQEEAQVGLSVSNFTQKAQI